jgi:hypothetical protein
VLSVNNPRVNVSGDAPGAHLKVPLAAARIDQMFRAWPRRLRGSGWDENFIRYNRRIWSSADI